MPLLNYTTSVPVTRTISEIQRLLVRAGAAGIMTEYQDGESPTGLSFVVEGPFGRQGYTLPVATGRVQVVLTREKVSPRYRSPEHAQRVAWRILKDWLEAQLALLATEMVTLDQVMLPYMRTPEGDTVYDRYLETGRLALEAGAEA